MNFYVFIFVGVVNFSFNVAQGQNENSRNASPEPTNTDPGQPHTNEKLTQGQRYVDRDQNDVLNIGNGQGKRNFVIVNENPTNTEQYPAPGGTNDRNGVLGNRFNSDYSPPASNPNTPNSRRGPNVNNIGNGAGNENWVVIQDTEDGGRTVSTLPRSNFNPRNNNPNSNYPNGNYPNGNYPNGNYPNGNYPNGYYPNGNRNGNYPNNNRPYNDAGVNYRTPDSFSSIGHGTDNHNTVIINGRTVVDSRSGSDPTRRQGEQRARFHTVYVNGKYINIDDDTLKVLPIIRRN